MSARHTHSDIHPQDTRRRLNRRSVILTFFVANMGEEFKSGWLHAEFGSALRTRISELNRDPACPIVIRNRTDENDESVYWAVPRQAETSVVASTKHLASGLPAREETSGLPPKSNASDALIGSLFDITPPLRWRDDG